MKRRRRRYTSEKVKKSEPQEDQTKVEENQIDEDLLNYRDGMKSWVYIEKILKNV